MLVNLSNIWHGTSIQCVEPKPKCLLIPSEVNSSSSGIECAQQWDQQLQQIKPVEKDKG